MKLFWVLIILFFISIVPLVPYEKEVQSGVVKIENRSLFSIAKEHYENTQRVGVVSSEVPKVSGDSVVPETKHVQ